jgi:hypothetical protein
MYLKWLLIYTDGVAPAQEVQVIDFTDRTGHDMPLTCVDTALTCS